MVNVRIKTAIMAFGLFCLVPSGRVLSADAAPKAVSVAAVKSQQISPQMMVSGQVYSRQQANLSTGVDGRLAWIVEPGQQVAAGEKLATIDLLPLQLRLAEQQAHYKRAEIQAKLLQKELVRLQSLVAKSLISQNQLDQQQAEYDLALADLELTKAAVAQLQDQVRRGELVAPFAGVVSVRHHQVGEEISRSSPLLQLVSLGELEIRVFAPLQYAGFIAPSTQLTVYSSSGEPSGEPNGEKSGEKSMLVRSMIPVSDLRSQTYEVRLTIPTPLTTNYQVGQLVTVAIPTGKAELSLVVHRDAIVLGQSQHHVYKLVADKVVKVPVKLGQGQGEWIHVEADLTAQDQVVVRGAETLNDGESVKVLSAKDFQLATRL